MVLIKYSGKYVKIYFNMKITYLMHCSMIKNFDDSQKGLEMVF